jgi:hypothetical protein
MAMQNKRSESVRGWRKKPERRVMPLIKTLTDEEEPPVPKRGNHHDYTA